MKQLHDLQVEVLTRLFAVGTVLGPALNEGLAEQGLSTARAEVIWRLRNHGPMNQRRLSDLLQCSPRNVTGLVDALEDAELVGRAPHPTDRRATLVSLTEKGRATAQSWERESEQLAARILDGIPKKELVQFLSTLDGVLGRLGAPTPAG